MKPDQPVFLDTSIQVERILGAKQKQVEIEHHLATSGYQFVTSHYVFMEFQRSVISDHVHVHNQIRKYKDWEETANQLRSGTRTHRPRSLVRSMQIFTRTLVVSQMQREIALSLLKIQIERNLAKRFWRYVNPIPDLVHCDLVAKGSSRGVNGEFITADSCRKATAACNLPHFLAQQQPQLYTIANYLATCPQCIKGQMRVEHFLSAAINNPQDILGQTACWPLGDMIIALQVPTGARLWTLDADLAAFTSALGMTLYEPDYN
ncbi:MAG: hypothetical protein R3C14_05445 [Caldilineaceae bacterium]